MFEEFLKELEVECQSGDLKTATNARRFHLIVLEMMKESATKENTTVTPDLNTSQITDLNTNQITDLNTNQIVEVSVPDIK